MKKLLGRIFAPSFGPSGTFGLDLKDALDLALRFIIVSMFLASWISIYITHVGGWGI